MSNTTDRKPTAPPTPEPRPGGPQGGQRVGLPGRLLRLVRRLGLEEQKARQLVDGILAALGLGRDQVRPPAAVPTDVGTTLAHARTDLAMERTYWAAERTLMGWVRTSLSMISFGFTIGKLGQVAEVEVRGLRGMRTIGAGTIAYMLVVLGTLALLAASVQYCMRIQELCAQGLPRKPSIAFVVAVLLAVLGIGAFGSLVLKL
jgi:putative membrane protein